MEEGILGDGQGIGVDQGAAAHAHARQGRHMGQEGHLEDAPAAHLRRPEEALEVPVGLGEVARAQAAPLLQDQDLVALLCEPQGADAAAETRADDDVVPHHGHASSCR